MRLSEAMMLGSTTCRMQAGDWNSCALGTAANAMRLPRDFNFSFGGVRYESYLRIQKIASMWPWLKISYEPELYEEQPDSPGRKIYQMFDDEVCRNHITFEQLVDYVRTIEPECGECNQYECRCQKSPSASQVEIPVLVVG